MGFDRLRHDDSMRNLTSSITRHCLSGVCCLFLHCVDQLYKCSCTVIINHGCVYTVHVLIQRACVFSSYNHWQATTNNTYGNALLQSTWQLRV